MVSHNTERYHKADFLPKLMATNSGGVNKTVISDVARKMPLPETKKLTDTDQPPTSATAAAAGTCSAMSFAGYALPHWLVVGMMLSMIFGGCCSNVFALENIIEVEPASGTLLTFVQFVFVAITSYGSQLDTTQPPFFLKPNEVPLTRWLIIIVLFFSINVLNNHAFSYDISVPVHIILRSGGSIATMITGYLFGKRYSKTQIVAVILLTAGVITAACSDAQTKRNSDTDVGDQPRQHGSTGIDFGLGLAILFVAQTLSAFMGLYTEATYKRYGPHWEENLFYSHLLSIPLFLPFAPALLRQLMRLANSPPLHVVAGMSSTGALASSWVGRAPSQLVYLAVNVLTQYACIRGVNLLAAASTALTVTIVLNIRKLASLLLSMWLFGHQLTTGTLIGAIVVFSAGGLYSLDSGSRQKPKEVATSRLKDQKHKKVKP